MCKNCGLPITFDVGHLRRKRLSVGAEKEAYGDQVTSAIKQFSKQETVVQLARSEKEDA